MKELLNQIIDTSFFVCPAFDGKILLKGRILSPNEAEEAGVIQFMIASELIQNTDNLKDLNKIQDSHNDDASSILETMRDMGFSADMLQKINKSNDKILTQVIKSASIDNGVTWEPLQLVLSPDKQSADNGRLWIGTINKEDRTNILDKAMSGYKEGSKKIKEFFRSGA